MGGNAAAKGGVPSQYQGGGMIGGGLNLGGGGYSGANLGGAGDGRLQALAGNLPQGTSLGTLGDMSGGRIPGMGGGYDMGNLGQIAALRGA